MKLKQLIQTDNLNSHFFYLLFSHDSLHGEDRVTELNLVFKKQKRISGWEPNHRIICQERVTSHETLSVVAQCCKESSVRWFTNQGPDEKLTTFSGHARCYKSQIVT